MESMEDRQKICDLLCEALRLTEDFRELRRIHFEEQIKDEEGSVTFEYSNGAKVGSVLYPTTSGMKILLVSMGIAMTELEKAEEFEELEEFGI